MMRKLLIAAGAVMLTAAAAYPQAKDADVESLVQKGLKAYKDGKAQDAIKALQDAIAIIQKSQEKGLAAFFPKPPAGWEAGEIESGSGAISSAGASGSMSYTHLSRRYTHKADKGEEKLEVTVSMTNSPQLIEPQKAMVETYRKPEIMKAMNMGPTKFTLIDKDGWIGWKTVDKDSRTQIIALSGGCMLEVSSNKADEKGVDLLFGAIDLKGLAAAQPAKSGTGGN